MQKKKKGKLTWFPMNDRLFPHANYILHLSSVKVGHIWHGGPGVCTECEDNGRVKYMEAHQSVSSVTAFTAGERLSNYSCLNFLEDGVVRWVWLASGSRSYDAWGEVIKAGSTDQNQQHTVRNIQYAGSFHQHILSIVRAHQEREAL